jgi:hypothetical protein
MGPDVRRRHVSGLAAGALALAVALAPSRARAEEPTVAPVTPPPPPPAFPNASANANPNPTPNATPTPNPNPNSVLTPDPTSARPSGQGSTPLWHLHWNDADESGSQVVVLDPGAPPPVGYKLQHRPRRALINGGIAVLASSYGLSVTFAGLCALFGCKATTHGSALLIPVAGPWIQIAQTSSATGNVVLASDALGQLTGVAMITLGYVLRQETFVPEGFLSRLTLAPMLGAGRTGMGIAGTF